MKSVRPFIVGILLALLTFYSALIILLSLTFSEIWVLAFLTLPVPWIAMIVVTHRKVFDNEIR